MTVHLRDSPPDASDPKCTWRFVAAGSGQAVAQLRPLTPIATGDRIVSVTAVDQRTPEAFLGARVDELDGHWLELLCGCGAKTFFPVQAAREDVRREARRRGAPSVSVPAVRRSPRPRGRYELPREGMAFPDAWTVTLLDATAG